jgi:hypothetical protein
LSDVILDDGEQVTVLCNNLNVQGHDLLLDSPARRTPTGPRFRRAMVHDANDSLTINFASDYPGGLALNGVTEVRPLRTANKIRPVNPTLVVRGGISYEAQGVTLEGKASTITVDVDVEMSKLKSQVAALVAKVTALEQRP